MTIGKAPMADLPHAGLPQAAAPFVAFPTLLRQNGFSVAPDQTLAFVEGVGLLGPQDMDDIRRAGLALLAPPPERRAEFDALFDAFFLGRVLAAPSGAPGEEEDDLLAQDAADDALQAAEADEIRESGAEATAAERLSARGFAPGDENAALTRLARLAPKRLPRRRSYRRAAAKTGDAWHLRRILREAARRDGEALTLPKLRRKTRHRRIVLLIDVSGSMKEQTDGALRFAYTLLQAGERVEVFTIGTRLTRITRPLSQKSRGRALEAASALVADWDGGTRIGDALQAFLSVPRFAGFARGALVLILSDGLERGDPQAMVDAVRRLSRLAWAVDWLTPLAAQAGFAVRTEALSAAAPHLAHIADGGGVDRLCAHVLDRASSAMARRA